FRNDRCDPRGIWRDYHPLRGERDQIFQRGDGLYRPRAVLRMGIGSWAYCGRHDERQQQHEMDNSTQEGHVNFLLMGKRLSEKGRPVAKPDAPMIHRSAEAYSAICP